jgi:Icc-related predicted phosphoesterase
MKIHCISDTHGFHESLKFADDIDMIIHAGDFSNSKSPTFNHVEALEFLDWFNIIPVKYKVLVAGNHDISMEVKSIDIKKFESIIYLEHTSVNIEGINIFGSPYTPAFRDWAFNVKRSRLDNYWKEIPNNTNILITHGPPKSILDLAYKEDNRLEFCGCKSLYNHVMRIKPKLHIFGHIHNNNDCNNQGLFFRDNITFINASCVTDGKFSFGLTSNGIVTSF